MPNATIKVQLPTGMKKIDVNLHKPVVFLNGQKRSIDKAWVFVNGEKKLLWGEIGVAIDYIEPSLDIGSVFAIGENWVDTSNGGVVSFWDMSNLSNITLKESVGWGDVGYQNEYQTTSGHPIYYGNTSVNANKMELNVNTGDLNVLSSINGLDNHTFTGNSNSYAFRTETLKKSFVNTSRVGRTPSSTVVTLTYGTNFYWNGSSRYSTGRVPSSTSDSNYALYMSGSGLQIDDNAFLINMVGTYSTGEGLYRAEYSGLTKIQASQVRNMEMLDGNKICCSVFVNTQSGVYYTGYVAPTDFYIVHSGNFSELFRMSVADQRKNVLRFVGELNGYYYLVKAMNYSNEYAAEVKLLLVDKETYQTVWEQDLPVDPFNQFSGKGTFWASQYTTATVQKSQTGFLALTYRDSTSGVVKIVRFGGLL
ncbi:MAG: hypothetical protein IIZ94_04775 [Prevotella sp.]|nr:hypothetical protein [Prevotella sp.]